MDARNPLCRFAILASALTAVIGCQSSGAGPTVRGQLPQDPLAPVAPPPPPALATTPAGPVATPGVTTAVPGAPVPGSPVPPGARGPVVNAGYTGGVKSIPTAAEMLKNGVPRVKVVAVVGANNVITDQEVVESVWQHNEELSRLAGRERQEKFKELYTAALRRTIERELILDDMYAKLKKANKMAVIEEIRETAAQTTSQQIREIKKRAMSQTDEEFAAWLRVQGLTLPVLRRQFERQFMSQQYVNSMMREKGRKPGLAEIRDYYDAHPEEFRTPDRVKWLHIFVRLNGHATPREAYDHAEALRKAAEAGGDFTALARQYDEGFAKMQNGFGTGEYRGKIQPPDLEETVWSLRPGQMSGLLQTATGYHLVKVVEREVAGVQPFDAAVQGKIRETLREQYREAEMKKLVDSLWRRGVVRVMEE